MLRVPSNETEITAAGCRGNVVCVHSIRGRGFIDWLDPLSAGHEPDNFATANRDYDENRRHNCRHADGPDRGF